MQPVIIHTGSANQSQCLGARLGAALRGGEIVRLISDIGGGKTTFVKGIASGMGSSENVQSPTFIIGAVYECAREYRLYHYDFYRLSEPGIMRDQLADALGDPKAVTVIEWGAVVEDVLNRPAVTVTITATGDNQRTFTFDIPEQADYLNRALQETA